MTTETRTGADCVIEGLREAGADIVFGLPGGAVLDIFSKLYHADDMKLVLVRHEQGATHMADGYARATGKVGVCLVTSGPGATNAVTGLATAYMDGIPMVCISGQVPSHMIGNDAFQEADTTGITRAVTKHNYLVHNADDLPRIFAEAFHIASTGKPGPVLIDIPKDVQRAATTAAATPAVNLAGYRPQSGYNPEQVKQLADAINTAKRPLLYTGGGVIAGNASAELTALAHKANIPVTTTLMGLGGFPETDPLALRMLGMHGSMTANLAVGECDLLISVGARFDDRVTGRIAEFAPTAKKAHIDIDPSSINKSVAVDIPVVGHAKDVLAALTDLVDTRERGEWVEHLSEQKARFPLAYDEKTEELLPQYVIDMVYKVSNGEALIVTDVGQHQMWAAHFFKYTAPRTFLSSGGLGTMGYGLPAGIGAQAAFPDKNVVVLSGDGSIQMCFQELVVAVEHGWNVNTVILNNGHLGMVRQWQEMFYGKEYAGSVLKQEDRPANEKMPPQANDEFLPDFVKLAEAYGAIGVRVTCKEDVVPALEKAFSTKAPVVIECIVKEEENVYPMVPPGASLDETILSMV
ncbi:MAG: biosynthetic-type acetolactate synthase large subunit [Verrucomicrobia bacterium]|jgi:acetolactate synthase I/II/III large subunit|nr:biosynthetic-type acetolactate synthase large subunit [Verrucomicrobiota bacterium]MBT7066753.1 biosynthetic-type acetolactate synthase large subunit [Verrucomicrobiota bacterium]MBT7701095.1 biosynthetic-type acetolactate synthase large subunit [Verrucomicrobiota bacterium]